MTDAQTITQPHAASKSMDDIVALSKRRGFIYPASEIYGGINGFWDFGPLGALLKNNVRDAWWRAMVLCPPIGPDGHPLQIVGLDSAIIQNPRTWEASGHVGGFNDPMMDDKETKARYRADHIWVYFPKQPASVRFGIAVEAGSFEEAEQRFDKLYQTAKWQKIVRKAAKVFNFNPDDHYWLGMKRPGNITEEEARNAFGPAGEYPGTWEARCGTELSKEDLAITRSPDADEFGTLTEPRMFNLMFETYIGAIRDEDAKAYLRPETAQGIFLNYKNVLDTTRVKVPFGIAQVGKAFRNEVTPRNFIFRSREFEQMEMEWFCPPDQSQKWYEFWKDQRMKWWRSLGVAPGNLRFREHDQEELAHYSNACVDVEYQYPFTAPGFGELEGIAHRGDFDLTQHMQHSGAKLEYFDQQRNQRYLPHVIEPASGLTRGVLVLLCEAFTPDPSRPSKVFMKFHPAMAPVKAGIFPLVNKDGMPEIGEKLYLELRKKYAVEYDAKQSIGKRYARMDEAGAPYCFTIDGDTLKDNTVTVRHRDTCQQQRINIDRVTAFLTENIDRGD